MFILRGSCTSRRHAWQRGYLLMLLFVLCRGSSRHRTDSREKRWTKMKTSLARHIISLHPVPLYAVVLASITSFVLLVIHMMGWQLWIVSLLILLAWSPIFGRVTLVLYRQY